MKKRQFVEDLGISLRMSHGETSYVPSLARLFLCNCSAHFIPMFACCCALNFLMFYKSNYKSKRTGFNHIDFSIAWIHDKGPNELCFWASEHGTVLKGLGAWPWCLTNLAHIPLISGEQRMPWSDCATRAVWSRAFIVQQSAFDFRDPSHLIRNWIACPC